MIEFADFIQSLPSNPADLSRDIIGKDMQIDGPFGKKKMIYADYVASGRALKQIEDFVASAVLPYYGNSHSEDSHCGRVITQMREEARALIARSCGANDNHAVLFNGAGATAGVNKLVHLLRAHEQGVAVLIGPYEHHSNILPWREAGAQVIEIKESEGGGVCLEDLESKLRTLSGRLIGSFSAMSNISGLTTDVIAVTRILKAAGATVIWDYAGAAPYLPVSMEPAPGVEIDAIVLSPHKFIGGPAASGVTVMRRDAALCALPTLPGGGTVRFVSSKAQDYHQTLELREEGGTPNIIGDIRAGLVFAVKDHIGQDWITERNRRLSQQLLKAAEKIPRLVVLGSLTGNRMPILSFRLRAKEGFYNYKLATKVLSDYFGIQARGGCACAGPYAIRLAGFDDARCDEVRREIASSNYERKPGFVRLNLSYLMSDEEIDIILSALSQLPARLDEVAGSYIRENPSGPYLYQESKQRLG